MAAISDQAVPKAPAPANVLWQWIRVVIGIIAAAIGVYQLTRGNGLGGAFSFAMAATFLIGTVFERAFIRHQQKGAVAPTHLLIISAGFGAAAGGTLLLGVLLVLRAL